MQEILAKHRKNLYKRRMNSKSPAIEQAATAVGNKSMLARALGIQVQSIQQWKRIPAERVLDVERISGISRYVLRPDIFGPAPLSQEQEAA